MKKSVFLAFGIFLAAGMAVASPQQTAPKPEEKAKVFVGSISDSMCGAHHVMGGTAKECTLECVDSGSDFVLVDGKPILPTKSFPVRSPHHSARPTSFRPQKTSTSQWPPEGLA